MLWSPSTGILARTDENDSPSVHAVEAPPRELSSSWHALSFIRDWEELSDTELDRDRIAGLLAQYRSQQAESACLALLDGLETPLRDDLISGLEEFFQQGVPPQSILDRMLLAPLRDTDGARLLSKEAQARGHFVTAELFASLVELQPLLRRFCATWLSLDPLAVVGRTPQEVWRRLVNTGALRVLLQAASVKDFRAHWTDVVLAERTPAGRIQAGALGESLAKRLFPAEPLVTRDVVESEPEEVGYRKTGSRLGHPFERLETALRQVDAIAESVAQGRDVLARRFLRQLIDSQVLHAEVEHAVKSLCNIAQRCADMFRADFERDCLDAALRLAPLDSWTLVQWGDHLKRAGAFVDAQEQLQRAASLSTGERWTVAISGLADVATEQRDFARAVSIYHSIPGWQDNLTARTALADILRIQGELQAAREEYELILSRWPEEVRPMAGLAEIAKYEGDAARSVAIYRQILSRPDIDRRSEMVYRMSACGALRRTGGLAEALKLVDDTVQDMPFMMRARVERGAILALMDRQAEAFAGMPASGTATAQAWARSFVRGLILLQLRRIPEARIHLVDQLVQPVASQGEKLVKLSAALLYLAEQNEASAEHLLSAVGPVSDRLIGAIKLVLDLHVAQAKRDRSRAEALLREWRRRGLAERDVATAIAEVNAGRFQTAIRLEAALLLRAA